MNEGWLIGAPVDMQARVRDKLVEVMEDTNNTPQLRLRTAVGLSSIFSGVRDNIKAEAALIVKSRSLNEQYVPTEEEVLERKRGLDAAAKEILNWDLSPEESALFRSLMKQAGILPPEMEESSPEETGETSGES